MGCLRNRIKKEIVLYGIFIIVIFSRSNQACATETTGASIQSYSEQTNLYRKLFPSFHFQYHYQAGDKIKYKVQMRSWIKKYIDAGPRAFHGDTIDLILDEQVKSVTDNKIELAVKVTYKNTKEPLYWGSAIAIFETEGEVVVNLYKNSWIPDIFNPNTLSSRDFNAIEAVLKKVIPQVNTPIFFPLNIDGESPPGFLTNDIDGWGWGREAAGVRFKGDMYGVIRNFENIGNSKCAIFDTIVVTHFENGGQGVIYGTVYFDYENGRVIKLNYSSSEEYLDHLTNKNKLANTGYVTMDVEMLAQDTLSIMGVTKNDT